MLVFCCFQLSELQILLSFVAKYIYNKCHIKHTLLYIVCLGRHYPVLLPGLASYSKLLSCIVSSFSLSYTDSLSGLSHSFLDPNICVQFPPPPPNIN